MPCGSCGGAAPRANLPQGITTGLCRLGANSAILRNVAECPRGPVATENAVIVGLLITFAEVVTLSWFRAWEEWINVVLGLWLAISPGILPIASAAAKANFVIVGVSVAALALYKVWTVSCE